MGKQLSDLKLSPDEGPGKRDELAIDLQRWQTLERELEEMLASDAYSWCWSTLSSLLADLGQRGRLSERQRQAIQNIKAGHQRHEDAKDDWERAERRTGRRYEGWSGRGGRDW